MGLHETSRETSFGFPEMIKAKNREIYKQTNKQINMLRSYISQPNHVRSSQNFQGIFLWVSQDD